MRFEQENSLSTINLAIKNISIRFKDVQNILLVDEVLSANEISINNSLCDWSSLNTTVSNVNVLLALKSYHSLYNVWLNQTDNTILTEKC